MVEKINNGIVNKEVRDNLRLKNIIAKLLRLTMVKVFDNRIKVFVSLWVTHT